MSNVLNYFEQPDSTGDNPLYLGGTVYVTGTVGMDSSVAITSGHTATIQSGAALNIASGGAANIQSGGTLTIASGGALSVPSGGDINVGSSGAINIASGGDIAIASGGTVSVASGGAIAIANGGDINLVSGAAINLATGADIAVGSGGTVSVASGGAVNVASGANIAVASGGTISIANGGDINVASGGEITVASGGALNSNGSLVITGSSTIDSTAFTANKLKNVLLSNEYLDVSTNTALNIYGYNVIAGGTGLSAVTLAAPQPGVRCVINIASISSGSVVVTTALGVTFDGTNNTATFDAVNDQLILVYKSSTEWKVVYNNSVTLSSV